MLAIGTIDYLNTQPIEYTLERHAPGIPRLRGVPTAINRALIDGRVVVAPISSYTFAHHTNDLLLIPNLAIATLGAVKSVLLFSWRPDPHELDGCPIALTDHSATSNRLLQVLCEHHYHISPQWQTMSQDLETMLAVCEAALVIGDRAIIEGIQRRHIGQRGLPYCFDLGEEWLKLTGLPFTFAVWAVRRDALAEVRASGIVSALVAAKADGLRHIDTIAQLYAPRLRLPVGVCAKYLRDLRYDFDANDRQGLATFLSYALPDFTWSQIIELADLYE